MRPVDLILERAQNVRKVGDGHLVSCPLRGHGKGLGDQNPSVSVAEGDDGRALVNCLAGCDTEEIVPEWGLAMADLFESRNGYEGGGGSYPSGKSGYVNTDVGGGCTLADYAAAKGLRAGFLETLGVTEIPNYNGHPAVRFPYLNTEREEMCVRFRVSLNGSPKIKTRRGDKLTLYGLWRLEEARRRGYAIGVEGESDTQTLWYHDEPSFGIPGASSWRSEWSEHLDGIERVYVVVEPDQGGEQLWERLIASPIRERLYRVTLDGFKDVSEMHLDSPERFSERLSQALGRAVSFTDIAESEAREQAREAWAKCEELAHEERILDRFGEILRASGVAGDSRAGKLIYLAMNSRHLDVKQLVNVAVKGLQARARRTPSRRPPSSSPKTPTTSSRPCRKGRWPTPRSPSGTDS